MPRPPKNKQEETVTTEWKPNLSMVLSVEKNTGTVLVGGQPVDATTLENMKAEAAILRKGVLLNVLGSTIESFAVKYALKSISIKESAESRSSQLAYAQAMSDLNNQLWTNILLLSKM